MENPAPYRALSETDYQKGSLLRVLEDELQVDERYNFVAVLDASRFVEFQSVLVGINERRLGRVALTLALLDTNSSDEPFTHLNAASQNGLLTPNKVRLVSHRFGNIGFVTEGYLSRGTSGDPSEALSIPGSLNALASVGRSSEEYHRYYENR